MLPRKSQDLLEDNYINDSELVASIISDCKQNERYRAHTASEESCK